MPNAFALGFSDIPRECVELAGQRRLMSGQNSGQRSQLRRAGILPRELGCSWGKINPNLVLPLFTHDQRPSLVFLVYSGRTMNTGVRIWWGGLCEKVSRNLA